MKKYSITIVIALLIGFTIFTGCQTQEKKVEAAQAEVNEAKEDLKDVMKDTKSEDGQVAFAKEWKIFKAQTELNIKNNEARIATLKTQMKVAGKKIDAAYESRIDTLQMKNTELQEKMNTYSNGKTDWEAFKGKFNDDMNKLGKALKDFTIDIKK